MSQYKGPEWDEYAAAIEWNRMMAELGDKKSPSVIKYKAIELAKWASQRVRESLDASSKNTSSTDQFDETAARKAAFASNLRKIMSPESQSAFEEVFTHGARWQAIQNKKQIAELETKANELVKALELIDEDKIRNIAGAGPRIWRAMQAIRKGSNE